MDDFKYIYGQDLAIEILKSAISKDHISPDITFLLDISAEESIKRRKNRKDDRIEKEGKDFLSNVSLGFRALSEDSKWKKISAVNSKERILSEIQSEIKKMIKNK